MSLFVDSSVWYAAVDAGDSGHPRARSVLTSSERFVTTDYVLVETWMLLRARLGRQVAEEFWKALRAGISIVEMVKTADLEVAWGIGQTFPDQDFSIVDRTSFAVMQRLGIERAASFDSDFSIYRYGSDRRRSFIVIG